MGTQGVGWNQWCNRLREGVETFGVGGIVLREG
jgi:hypothetical protein